VGRGAPGRWGEGAPIRMAGRYAVAIQSSIEKVKVRLGFRASGRDVIVKELSHIGVVLTFKGRSARCHRDQGPG
jgi:hypothetical protein